MPVRWLSTGITFVPGGNARQILTKSAQRLNRHGMPKVWLGEQAFWHVFVIRFLLFARRSAKVVGA